MSRDPAKLKVFGLADELVLEVYRAKFPPVERYGLQSQVRRAAVSVAANIIEGCARRSTRDYLRFIEVALASASETRYLLDLSHRLGIVASAAATAERYVGLIKGLEKLSTSLSRDD